MRSSRQKLKKQKYFLSSTENVDLKPGLGDRAVIRIVDHCLAAHGWTGTARRRMLAAIKHGRGGDHLSAILRDSSAGENLSVPECPR